MDATQRQRQILTMMATQRTVKIKDLSASLAVTRETIRKDLNDLAERGLVTKIHGGAIRSPNMESAYERRKHLRADAKAAIAATAARLVTEPATVYLDYGTTTFMLAAELRAQDPELTLACPALPIIAQLLDCPHINLIVPGGLVRQNENSLYGPLTQHAFAQMYFDVGFFGCGGIDAVAGVTNHHPLETNLSAMVMPRCQRVVLVTDVTKVGQIAANKTADLSALDDLVIDELADEPLTEALRQADCTVHFARR